MFLEYTMESNSIVVTNTDVISNIIQKVKNGLLVEVNGAYS